MIFNYIKITIRNILRHKVYSIINILGLALGIAVSLLIFLIVNNHLNFDEHFKNADRLYRVTVSTKFEQEEGRVIQTPLPLAGAIVEYSKSVEKAVRVLKGSHKLVSYKDRRFTAENFYYADADFVELFEIEIVKGNKKNPLKDSATIIITEKTAERYFKKDNPIGKTLKLDNGRSFKVTAVCKPFPAKTHFRFDFIADLKIAINESTQKFSGKNAYLQWQNDIVSTYILTKENADINQIQDKLDKIVEKEIQPHIKAFTGLSLKEYEAHNNYYFYEITKITDIHTGKSYEGEFEQTYPDFYITIFLSIAVIVLILACINFMNLTTARSSIRAVEIGIRKASGASKKQLIFQFLLESVILTGLSLIIAIAFIEFLYFSDAGAENFRHDLTNLPYILFFIFIVGIFAGSYPAFYLSSLKPIYTLHGKISRGIKSVQMRRVLVLIQLTITFVILISRGVIMQQINFLGEKNLGNKSDYLLVVKRAYTLDSLKKEFVNEIRKNENIIDAAYINTLPGENVIKIPMIYKGNKKDIKYLHDLRISESFFSTFEIDIADTITSDTSNLESGKEVIINQSAANLLGITELNDSLYLNYFGDEKLAFPFRIKSIAEDFHFQPLFQEIKPMILNVYPENRYFKYLVIRINKQNRKETINFINQKWNKYVKDNIFEAFPLQHQIRKLYKKEHNTAALSILFSILAVLIATMGIFGLTAFTTEKRTREIGIRKALGTPVYKIVYLLSAEYIKWLLIAFVIAGPIAWLLMDAWLDRFAYHVGIDWIIFLEVGIFMFMVTLITVILLSLKAALKNPANSLRYQ